MTTVRVARKRHAPTAEDWENLPYYRDLAETALWCLHEMEKESVNRLIEEGQDAGVYFWTACSAESLVRRLEQAMERSQPPGRS